MLSLALLLTVAAAADRPPSGKCVAGTGERLIGRRPDARVQRRLRAETGATAVRLVHPGEMVAMIFIPSRVTATLDRRGRIVRIACG